jgi:hypothetical protein
VPVLEWWEAARVSVTLTPITPNYSWECRVPPRQTEIPASTPAEVELGPPECRVPPRQTEIPASTPAEVELGHSQTPAIPANAGTHFDLEPALKRADKKLPQLAGYARARVCCLPMDTRYSDPDFAKVFPTHADKRSSDWHTNGAKMLPRVVRSVFCELNN